MKENKKKFNWKLLYSFRFIVLYLALISVSIVLGLRYGDLIKRSTGPVYKNIPFSEEGFTDFTTRYNELGETIDKPKNNNKLVASNDRFEMFIDEETTIVTLHDKINDNYYYSAKKDSPNSSEKSNFELLDGNKKTARISPSWYESYNKSVKYRNALTEKDESHYKIKYLENSVQVLYEIGNFSAYLDYFPERILTADFDKEKAGMSKSELQKVVKENLRTFEGRFSGNVVFQVFRTTLPNGDQVNSFFNKDGVGEGKAYSEAAVEYIEKNNLAEVEQVNEREWTLKNISPDLINGNGTHLNSKDSPCYSNLFLLPEELFKIKSLYHHELPAEEAIKGMLPSHLVGRKFRIRETANQAVLKEVYRLLFTTSPKKTYEGYNCVDDDHNQIIVGGFPKIDKDNNFVYEGGELKRDLYTLALTAEDNEKALSNVKTQLTIFQVGIEFRLTLDGIKVTVMKESLRDGYTHNDNPKFKHDAVIHKIKLTKGFTTVYNEGGTKEEGKIIIPDGSGAYINFNSPKVDLGFRGYSKPVYGRSMTNILTFQPEQTEYLAFPMFGLIHSSKGRVLDVISEDGGARATLFADAARGTDNFNYAYFTHVIREQEDISISKFSAITFPRFAQEMAKSDTSIVYRVIVDPKDHNLGGVAKDYANYLESFYGLKRLETKKSSTRIDYVGVYEEATIKAGFKARDQKSLTNLKNISEIEELLHKDGVNNLEENYEYWTYDAMEPKYRTGFRAASILGGKKKILGFNSEHSDIGYLQQTMFARGYKVPFGNLKYTARSIGNVQAVQKDFHIVTQAEMPNAKKNYFINPVFYEDYALKNTKSLKKYGINSLMINDLGNMMVTHFAKDLVVNRDDAIYYQRLALDVYKKNFEKLSLTFPFDYAFSHTSRALDVPFTSSAFGIFESSIPFYQMVAQNFFPLSSRYVNGGDDHEAEWYLLNALATGVNLSYQLSYTDPKKLIETEYTQYYKTYYVNWLETIKQNYEELQKNRASEANITNYEILKLGVSKTSYVLDGVTFSVVVNRSGEEYLYNGTAVNNNSYLKINE